MASHTEKPRRPQQPKPAVFANLLQKYGKKKVRMDVPETPGVGDGFQIRFRLSKAYRALEKQEHLVSKPNIQPYKKEKKDDDVLDELDDRAHAFLWAEDEDKGKKKKSQSQLIWDILGLNRDRDRDAKSVATIRSEKEKEKEQRKIKKDKSEAEALKRKVEDAKAYAKLLCKSMPLAHRNQPRDNGTSKNLYFQGVKNLAVGKAKANEPFRNRRVKQSKQKQEIDPEKAEKLRLAREKLKARSKYSSFWKQRDKTPKVVDEKKEELEALVPKMAWCAAENSLSLMEWEAKKRRTEMARRASTPSKASPKPPSRLNSREEVHTPIIPEIKPPSNPSTPRDEDEAQTEAPSEAPTDSPETEDGNDELFSDMRSENSFSSFLLNPNKSKDGASIRSGKSNAGSSTQTGSRRNSFLSQVNEEDDDGDSEDEARSDHGFASLLGSSSESSESSTESTASDESDESGDRAPKSRRSDRRKQPKSTAHHDGQRHRVTDGDEETDKPTLDSLKKKYGTQPKSGESRPSSASTRISSTGPRRTRRGPRTCRFLYRMCECEKISQNTTLRKLEGKGKAVGTIDVFGCPPTGSAPRRCKSAAPRLENLDDEHAPPTCPFCAVFPRQRIRAWMRYNEIMEMFDKDSI